MVHKAAHNQGFTQECLFSALKDVQAFLLQPVLDKPADWKRRKNVHIFW